MVEDFHANGRKDARYRNGIDPIPAGNSGTTQLVVVGQNLVRRI